MTLDIEPLLNINHQQYLTMFIDILLQENSNKINISLLYCEGELSNL